MLWLADSWFTGQSGDIFLILVLMIQPPDWYDFSYSKCHLLLQTIYVVRHEYAFEDALRRCLVIGKTKLIHHCNFRKTICMFSKWLVAGQPCSWVIDPHIKCLHSWWWCWEISKGFSQCPSFWSHSYLCVPNSNDVDSLSLSSTTKDFNDLHNVSFVIL